MILAPDDRLPHGPARWTREALSEAWASCRRDLRAVLLDPAIRTVAVLVGVPASGKSSWTREHDQPGMAIFDACWANRGRRTGIARQIRASGKVAVAVWVQTPLDVCRERNAARPPDTRVPDVALSRAWVALLHEPPVMAEGWSRVLVQSGQAELIHDAATPPKRALERLAKAPASQAWALVRSRLLPAYEAARGQKNAKPDAPPARVAQSIRGLGKALERGQAGDEALTRGLARVGQRMEAGQRKTWKALVRKQVKGFEAEPQDEMVDDWTERVGEQIAGVRQRIAPGLEQAVGEAWRKGWSTEQLKSHWSEHGLPLDGGGTAEGRGSVLGAHAHGLLTNAVTEAQQTAVGSDWYTWGPTASSNPDPEHAKRRGKRYRWSKPPKDGHPGQRHGCSCTAIPLLKPADVKRIRAEVEPDPVPSPTPKLAPAPVVTPTPAPSVETEVERKARERAERKAKRAAEFALQQAEQQAEQRLVEADRKRLVGQGKSASEVEVGVWEGQRDRTMAKAAESTGAKAELDAIDARERKLLGSSSGIVPKGPKVTEAQSKPELDAWVSSLTGEEKEAMLSWSDEGWFEIMKSVDSGRGIDGWDPDKPAHATKLIEARRRMVGMRSALAKAPRYEGTLHRGMRKLPQGSALRQALENPGEIVELETVSSWSDDPWTAKSFSEDDDGGFILQVVSKRGSVVGGEGVSYTAFEAEVMIDRGARFRVKSSELRPGDERRRLVILEELTD